jgi:KDO2-lipid IV(A) lauroyltransferase
MFNMKKEGNIGIYLMVSDQTPNGRNIHLWTPFLNQDTPTLTGTEQLARKFDYPVFYADIRRVKRGYYRCDFLPITLEPTKEPEFAISEKYMKLLENTIREQPAYWLWSHRRWKYQRNKD